MATAAARCQTVGNVIDALKACAVDADPNSDGLRARPECVRQVQTMMAWTPKQVSEPLRLLAKSQHLHATELTEHAENTAGAVVFRHWSDLTHDLAEASTTCRTIMSELETALGERRRRLIADLESETARRSDQQTPVADDPGLA